MRTGRPRPPISRRSTPRSAGAGRVPLPPDGRRPDPMVDRLTTPADWPAILLGRAGAADPTDLDEATRAGAFDGLRRAIRDLGATGTIATVAASGLRGRGGAGYPTAEKWRTAATTTQAPSRYVVANGYAADPAAGGDRFLMETDPFSVVEGAAIAAFAIGATEAIIAVRSEATETIRRLQAAIAAATDGGFLGTDVLGSGHDIAIEV